MSSDFWSLWPPGVNYQSMLAVQTGWLSGLSDIQYVMATAVLLIGVRSVFYRFVAVPIGLSFGLSNRDRKAPPLHAGLLASFAKSGKKMPNTNKIEHVAKEVGLAPRDVERWWRRQLAATCPSQLTKFKEALWRWVYYSCAVEPCAIWDVPNDVVLVYWVQLGFYMSLLITQFFDIRRKDFWEMFVHHVATIGLMTYSYATGQTRIGTVVLIVHDVSDIFLEAAKSFLYLTKLSDVTFIAFAVVFFLARLVVYPITVLHPVLFTAHCSLFFGRYIFFGLLFTLQLLHVFWFSIIVRMAVKQANNNGRVEKDARSDDAFDTVSDDDATAAAGDAVAVGAAVSSKLKSDPAASKRTVVTGLMADGGITPMTVTLKQRTASSRLKS